MPSRTERSKLATGSSEQEHRHYHQHYEALMEIFHLEVNSLFSRLNFFLIGTAFLVAAFVTAVVTKHPGSWSLSLLRHAIVAIGFCVALLFTVTNYLNAKLLLGIQRRLERDSKIVDSSPFEVVKEIKEKVWSLRRFWGDFGDAVCNPIGYKNTCAPHTWLVPILFALFWLFVWFAVVPLGLPHPNWQRSFPAFFGLVVLAYWIIRQFRLGKNKDVKMGRILVLHFTPEGRIQKPATPEQLKRFEEAFQEALIENPKVKYKGTFADKDGVGICDWQAPNAEAVENILKELKLPYDAVVRVEELKL